VRATERCHTQGVRRASGVVFDNTTRVTEHQNRTPKEWRTRLGLAQSVMLKEWRTVQMVVGGKKEREIEIDALERSKDENVR
jgi:hypothetical protein